MGSAGCEANLASVRCLDFGNISNGKRGPGAIFEAIRFNGAETDGPVFREAVHSCLQHDEEVLALFDVVFGSRPAQLAMRMVR